MSSNSAMPVRPDDRDGTTVDLIERRLEEVIFADHEVGGSLPSEANLCRQLGVSRLTLREALRRLEARGLVRISQGRRTIVAAPGSRQLSDFFRAAVRREPRALLDLLGIRWALEVHVAEVAAGRVGKASLAAMETAVDMMRLANDDPDRFHDADMQFHEHLAEAAGNRLIVMLLEELAGPLRASRVQSLAGHLTRGRPIAEAINQHAAILDRVREGDSRGAAAAMRQHLRLAEKDLLAGMQADPS